MLEIRDMELLAALARQKHFARAAQDCGISQPAFSARIRKLEKDLQTPIVLRGNRFQGFTTEGEAVVRWAHKLLGDVEGLRQEISGFKRDLTGTMTIGVVPTALPYAAKISSKLRVEHPSLIVNIQSLSSAKILQRMGDHSVDAGITYRDPEFPAALKFMPLYQETYVLVVPEKLAPRKSGTASWQEAANLPLCLLSKEMRNRQIVDGVFGEIGAEPETIMETNAFTAALAQVTSGVAATIAPQTLIDSLYLAKNSVCLKLEAPVVTNEIGLLTPVQDPPIVSIRELEKVAAISS